jgi:DNA-binding MarR family transcriptional regulator
MLKYLTMTTSGIKQSEIDNAVSVIKSYYLLRIVIFADVITRFSEIEMKNNNINWLKTFALIILVTLGNQTLSQLARLMLRSNHSMTRLIDNLVKEGFVKRYHANNDRRSLQVKITPTGLDYLLKTLKDIDIAEKEIRSYLEPEDLEKLISLSKTMRFRLIDKLSDKLA